MGSSPTVPPSEGEPFNILLKVTMSDFDPNYTPPDPSNMTDEEKIRTAYEWKQQGLSVVEISDSFGVSQKTVYNWGNKWRDNYLQELEECKALDVIIKHLSDINDLGDLCLRLVHQIGQEKSFDPRTGRITEKKGSLRDQAEMMRLVRDFKRMEIELQTVTGIIPREPERIYDKLSQRQVSTEVVEDTVLARPELERQALERFQKQRHLT